MGFRPGRTCRRVMLATFAAASGLVVAACSSAGPSPYPDHTRPLALPSGVEDQRGRFREIFCAILSERGATIPDARPCDEALTRAGMEPPGTGEAIDVGQARRPLVAVVVAGVGWDCISKWLDSEETSATHIRRFGYDVVAVDVESLSSSATNARRIRDAIMDMGRDQPESSLVLIGYSKGAPDILEAVVAYPEIRRHIAAVVSVAGAVRGSPVADEVSQSKLDLLRHWPGAECAPGDEGAIESLRPATRNAWLDGNTLPGDIPFYSIVTCPEPDRISAVLKPSYKKLGRIDPRNDGMVLFDDQIIPGSTFLACLNADHWAVSVPIARTHPHIGSSLVDENDYPREALLEALLRFVEEDLAHPPGQMQDSRSKMQDPPPAR